MITIPLELDQLPDESVLALAELLLHWRLSTEEEPADEALSALTTAVAHEADRRKAGRSSAAGSGLWPITEIVLPVEDGPDSTMQDYHHAYAALSHWIGSAAHELQDRGDARAIKWLTEFFTRLWAELDEEHLRTRSEVQQLESLFE